jgi:hypothetical protein
MTKDVEGQKDNMSVLTVSLPTIAPRIAAGVQQECERRFGNQIAFITEGDSLGFGPVDFQTVGTVGSLIMSAIALLLQVRSSLDITNKELEKKMTDQLSKVSGFEKASVSVENWEGNPAGNGSKYEMQVDDSNGEKWKVYVGKTEDQNVYEVRTTRIS